MKVTLLDKNPKQLKTKLRTEVHDIAEPSLFFFFSHDLVELCQSLVMRMSFLVFVIPVFSQTYWGVREGECLCGA